MRWKKNNKIEKIKREKIQCARGTYIFYCRIIILYGDDIVRVRSAQSIIATIYNIICICDDGPEQKRTSGTGSTLPKCLCAHSY